MDELPSLSQEQLDELRQIEEGVTEMTFGRELVRVSTLERLDELMDTITDAWPISSDPVQGVLDLEDLNQLAQMQVNFNQMERITVEDPDDHFRSLDEVEIDPNRIDNIPVAILNERFRLDLPWFRQINAVVQDVLGFEESPESPLVFTFDPFIAGRGPPAA